MKRAIDRNAASSRLEPRKWQVFQDLFLWKRIYGDVDHLLETIRGWGIERVEFVNTSNSELIPRLLKLPFMVGTIGILHGRK